VVHADEEYQFNQIVKYRVLITSVETLLHPGKSGLAQQAPPKYWPPILRASCQINREK
jgi:hypothetical protein